MLKYKKLDAAADSLPISNQIDTFQFFANEYRGYTEGEKALQISLGSTNVVGRW